MFSETGLARAIGERRLVSFTYKGAVRTAEPHLLGYDRSGDLTLSAWQTSGPRPGWRDFHVAKMIGLSIAGQTFARPRPGYNPMDTTLARVIARI